MNGQNGHNGLNGNGQANGLESSEGLKAKNGLYSIGANPPPAWSSCKFSSYYNVIKFFEYYLSFGMFCGKEKMWGMYTVQGFA